MPLPYIAALFMTVAGFILRRKRRKFALSKSNTRVTLQTFKLKTKPAEMEMTSWEIIDKNQGTELADTDRRELREKWGIKLPA